MPGGSPESHSALIPTLKSYFPLSTSCKEFFCVFLAGNKVAPFFVFLCTFTFRNKTFFFLRQKMFLLHGNLMPFPKEVFHSQKGHKPKHTLDVPCQQLHLKETSRQIPHQQGWRNGNREETTERGDAQTPSSSSSPLCQVQLGSLSTVG